MKPYVIQNYPPAAAFHFLRNAEAETLHEALQTAADLLATLNFPVKVFMHDDDDEYQMIPIAEMRFTDK